MRFSEMIQKTGPDLVIGGRHDEWLKNNSNPTYSKKALEFCLAELKKQATPRDRSGTVSASSLGSCRRRQIFTYLGMPEIPPQPKTAQIFQNGTMMHLRWQMAGLTEGWLSQAEVPVQINELELAGTQDGIAYDGSIVEFKSINSNGFRGVNTFGVKEEHRFQVGTYMTCEGKDKSVVVYECKDTQEYKELVVYLDEDLADTIRDISELVWRYIEDRELPEPLSECEARTGWKYNGCPFRDICLKTRNWEHAEEQR